MANVKITLLFVFCWSLSTINGQICGSAKEYEIIKNCGENITDTSAAFLDFHTENLQTNCSCLLTSSQNGRIHLRLLSIPNPRNCFTNIEIQKYITSQDSEVRHSLNCDDTNTILQTQGNGDVFSIRLLNVSKIKTSERNQFFYCLNISSEDKQNTYALSCQSLLDDQEENDSPADLEISLILIGIVCGAIGIILISGFVYFVFVLHKKKSSPSKNVQHSVPKEIAHKDLEKIGEDNIKEEEDEDDGLKDNPLYQSADDSQHNTYIDDPVNSGNLNNNCNIDYV